jgi:hypothetical protein
MIRSVSSPVLLLTISSLRYRSSEIVIPDSCLFVARTVLAVQPLVTASICSYVGSGTTSSGLKRLSGRSMSVSVNQLQRRPCMPSVSRLCEGGPRTTRFRPARYDRCSAGRVQRLVVTQPLTNLVCNRYCRRVILVNITSRCAVRARPVSVRLHVTVWNRTIVSAYSSAVSPYYRCNAEGYSNHPNPNGSTLRAQLCMAGNAYAERAAAPDY